MYLCGAFESARCSEDGCGSSYFDEMEGIDDAYASAFVQAEDGLCVLEVGVHLCGGIYEPCTQMFGGVVGVLFLTGELIRSDEGRDQQAQADHRFAMRVEVGWVGKAVAADVGAGRIFRIGPPVITLGVEVV
jgi:hypothetical protein